uniref:Uncharacterized protein n=1 Tax=Callithrix jacchus TaxID=9483 RepID=A0A8I3X4G0_CALJA
MISLKSTMNFIILLLVFFIMEFHSCCPGWSTMLQSRFTPISASWIQALFLPQSPDLLGLQVCHHVWLIFVFLVEIEFHQVGQAGLELVTSGDLPTLASQSAVTIGMSHCTVQYLQIFLFGSIRCLVIFQVENHINTFNFIAF